MSGPQRILILARTVSILGNFAAPVALSFAVLALTPGYEAASRLALVLAAAAARPRQAWPRQRRRPSC